MHMNRPTDASRPPGWLGCKRKLHKRPLHAKLDRARLQETLARPFFCCPPRVNLP